MKGLLQEKLLHNDPAFIAPYFAKLPKAITALKKRDVPMTDALKVSETAVVDFTLGITQAPSEEGKSVCDKSDKSDCCKLRPRKNKEYKDSYRWTE